MIVQFGKCAVMSLTAALFVSAQQLPYTPGSHRVETIDLAIDAKERSLPARVHLPRDGARYPVIVFSHGAGDNERTAPALMHFWASHGYVCILPHHAAAEEKSLRAKIRRLEREFELIDLDSAQDWRSRIDEIRILLDAIENADTQLPAIASRINPDRIGMAGHSLGARTTMLLAGAALFAPRNGPVSFKDARIDAAMLLSAVGTNGSTLTRDSWSRITVPMMVMSGSRDVRTPGESGLWRAEPFTYAPPGNKYLLYLNGADHLTYIGPLRASKPERHLPMGAPEAPNWVERTFPAVDQSRLFGYVCAASTAFWDAHLKADKSASSALTSGELDRISAGVAAITAK